MHKFRAWDTLNNQYFVPTYEAYNGKVDFLALNIESGSLLQIHLNGNALAHFCKSDRFILEQYIGFNDAHDAPIYEGDVVSYVIFGRKPSMGVIKYDDATAQYYIDNTAAPIEQRIILIHRTTSITVKGHIHEQTSN